jgi:2-polyprenyl-3-methyl-5-hydroxy-6-metoxy-1,4-benzoquinol methylase
MLKARIRDTLWGLHRQMRLSRNGSDRWEAVTCSTAEIVARQNRQAGFARVDLFIAYLAIQEAEGVSEGGLALLQKLLQNDPVGRTADRALYALLKQGSLSDALFIPAKPVVDAELRIRSKVAAVAVAIHTGAAEVVVGLKAPSLRRRRNPPRYDLRWLAGKGFTADELALVESAQAEVFRKLGILALPWETLWNVRMEMRRLLPKGSTLHGRGGIYQTCEELLIPGQRPTALRFRAYDLASILKPSDRVLDIGCNCGFLALLTSRHVKEVEGFDVGSHFIAMARIAQEYLARENCRFTTSTFSDFQAAEPFDVIFSFAVHHWIGMPIPEYAGALRGLLKPGGLVLLESQDLSTHDKDWEEKLRQFRSAGFEEVRSGTLCDDGLITRRHVVLRDTRAAGAWTAT